MQGSRRAGTPLANSSKQVPIKTDEAFRKPTTVFWGNKEGQDLEHVTFENLVVHFDQGKFEELSLEVVQCSTHVSIGRSR